MDLSTSTETLRTDLDLKTVQDSLLLDIIKQTCSHENDKLSSQIKGKVMRIIADCDGTYYSSLHKLSTADERKSTILGVLQKTSAELSFDEQVELNQAVVQKIQTKLPKLLAELDSIGKCQVNAKEELSKRKSHQDHMKELQNSLEEKMNTLQEQENENVELMMQWLNVPLQGVTQFSNDTTELLILKTRILDLKSKITHLQVLENILTETSQSIHAYSEIHKDLKDSIKETEERIKKYREIIGSEE